MSPSSNRRRLGLVLVTAAAVVSVAVPAAAEPPSPPQIPPGQPVTAPVLAIHAGWLDLRDGAVVEATERGGRSKLDATVLFGRDSARLRPGAAGSIRRVARHLRSFGAGTVTVTGYTDDLGTAAHGLDLSRRRARAVARVLRTELPADPYRVVSVGKGERDPAVPNTSEANRRKNRRVVITLDRR